MRRIGGFVLFLSLMKSEIALSEAYTCEANAIDRSGTLRVETKEGKTSLFSARWEIQGGRGMNRADVVMVTVKGIFVGATVIGPEDAKDPDSALVGGIYYWQEMRGVIPQVTDGTKAAIGNLACTFKIEKSLLEEAASVPLLPFLTPDDSKPSEPSESDD